jgi:methyl-accepting chemotaxis protein
MKITGANSIRSTFLTIQGLIGMMLLFLIIQGVSLWHVCHQGAQAIQGLQREGIPSLTYVATLKQNLNLYRLHSYELMFVQEKDRPAKAAAADAVNRQNLELLSKLNELFPSGQGQQLVGAVSTQLAAYTSNMDRLRAKMDKDFPGAMQMLDQEIPIRVTQLNDAVTQLANACDGFASERVDQTVGSFVSIKRAALGFGSANIGFGILVAVLVIFSSSHVRHRLAGLMNRLTLGSDHVNHSAASVAAASQTLAEGSSEQAASLEETSSSLEEMSSMTKNNGKNAQKANELARQTRAAADKGVSDMQAMSAAMEAIKVSSDDIAKIIKTIDEIAFQTNILALNAAVEAVRAGEAGMGFAVVADEVRNLAQRSAQAAKETAGKIEGAISKTAQGVDISSKVSQTLNDIVSKARQVDELAAEVASASREQTQGIAQINSAVGHMDSVTQTNAANAEQSAAAAKELNAQADTMKRSVLELLELVGGASQAPVTTKTAPVPHSKHTRVPALVAKPGRITSGNGHQPVTPPAPTVAVARRSEIPLEGDFKDF